MHLGIATLLCSHDTGLKPCVQCRYLVTPLVKPISRAIYDAGMKHRGQSPQQQADGYAAIGAAIEAFWKTASVKPSVRD